MIARAIGVEERPAAALVPQSLNSIAKLVCLSALRRELAHDPCCAHRIETAIVVDRKADGSPSGAFILAGRAVDSTRIERHREVFAKLITAHPAFAFCAYDVLAL